MYPNVMLTIPNFIQLSIDKFKKSKYQQVYVQRYTATIWLEHHCKHWSWQSCVEILPGCWPTNHQLIVMVLLTGEFPNQLLWQQPNQSATMDDVSC